MIISSTLFLWVCFLRQDFLTGLDLKKSYSQCCCLHMPISIHTFSVLLIRRVMTGLNEKKQPWTSTELQMHVDILYLSAILVHITYTTNKFWKVFGSVSSANYYIKDLWLGQTWCWEQHRFYLVDITQCRVHRRTESAVFTQTQVPACLTLTRPSAFSINQGYPMQWLLIDALIQWLSTVPMCSGVHPKQTPGITHRCITSRDRIEQRTYGALRNTRRRLILMQHTTEEGSYYC